VKICDHGLAATIHPNIRLNVAHRPGTMTPVRHHHEALLLNACAMVSSSPSSYWRTSPAMMCSQIVQSR